MRQSEQINELAAALSKAQAVMVNPLVDQSNPYFKSQFLSLAALIEAIRPMAEFGLSFAQTLSVKEGSYYLVTTLMHTSGQFIESHYPIICKDYTDPQKFGGATSYARRYSLQAIVGITGDKDDDGNLAAQEPHKKVEAKITPSQVMTLKELIITGEEQEIKDRLKKAFNSERIEDIPASQFMRVYNGLKQKREVEIDGEKIDLNPGEME